MTLIAYGNVGQGASTMTTHIVVGGKEWTVRGLWRSTASGWVFVQAQ